MQALVRQGIWSPPAVLVAAREGSEDEMAAAEEQSTPVWDVWVCSSGRHTCSRKARVYI